MRNYKKYVNTVLFILILFISFNSNHYPFVVSSIPSAIEVDKATDALYEEIKVKAESDEFREEPQDAYIDRVWKKTPGRNGREINIEKSYQNMKDEGKFNEDLLIYNKLKPEISLEDLPAAPIYRGHPEKEMVAFMINVSWGGEHIPSILETLKNNKIKASFFIEGKWGRENVELVKMINAEGHLIGNHAYSHPDMARINSEEITKEISQTNEILTAITGNDIKYFTPPSGSYTDEVVERAKDLEMETLLWTSDTVDWKKPSVSVMINRVNNSIHPGAIILMHPTPVIAEGLDSLIQSIQAENYRIGRIDRLLSEER